MVIDRDVLAFVLCITKDEAQKKIAVALAKINGGEPVDYWRREGNDISIEADQYETATGIPIIQTLERLKTGSLKSQGQREWIMQYPAAKLKVSKKTGALPRSVQLPPTLRRLICPTDKAEIIRLWNKSYASYLPKLNDAGEEVKPGVIFK